MKALVNKFRHGKIDIIEGRKVVAKEDYLNSVRVEADGTQKELTLPKSNVVKLFLEDDSWVVITHTSQPETTAYSLKTTENISK